MQWFGVRAVDKVEDAGRCVHWLLTLEKEGLSSPSRCSLAHLQIWTCHLTPSQCPAYSLHEEMLVPFCRRCMKPSGVWLHNIRPCPSQESPTVDVLLPRGWFCLSQ